jgi:co-chaperonin GroES (HSP10)
LKALSPSLRLERKHEVSTTKETTKEDKQAGSVAEQLNRGAFLVPTPGRCIVERDGFKYSGLLVIPEKHKQMPTTGRVIAVGDSDHMNLMGKRVVWGRFSGMPIQFSGFPAYDALTYDEIIAYVEDEDVKLSLEDFSGLNRTE